MREIKFRAWLGKEERMYDPMRLHFVQDGKLLVEVQNWLTMWEYPEDVKLMQFTGLKDKNGKKIYEGDIVVVDWGYNDYLIGANKLNKPFVMEFRNYSWFPFSHMLPAPHDIEVIGNIYEHGHLLENESKDK